MTFRHFARASVLAFFAVLLVTGVVKAIDLTTDLGGFSAGQATGLRDTFVDQLNTETIAGAKTFSDAAVFSGAVTIVGNTILGGVVMGAEVVTATNVITANESGTTFFLNAGTEFASTLPLPALGLRYKFIVSAAPSTGSYTIVTTSSANIINMMIVASTADDVGDFTLARDVITFIGTSAPGPSIVGDWVECISDATSWFCEGHESVAEGITVGQSG